MTTLSSTARLLQTCRVPVVQLRHAVRHAHGMDDARLRDADAVQSGLVRCTCGIMHQLVLLPVLLNKRKLRMSWRLRATTETAMFADLICRRRLLATPATFATQPSRSAAG